MIFVIFVSRLHLWIHFTTIGANLSGIAAAEKSFTKFCHLPDKVSLLATRLRVADGGSAESYMKPDMGGRKSVKPESLFSYGRLTCVRSMLMALYTESFGRGGNPLVAAATIGESGAVVPDINGAEFRRHGMLQHAFIPSWLVKRVAVMADYVIRCVERAQFVVLVGSLCEHFRTMRVPQEQALRSQAVSYVVARRVFAAAAALDKRALQVMILDYFSRVTGGGFCAQICVCMNKGHFESIPETHDPVVLPSRLSQLRSFVLQAECACRQVFEKDAKFCRCVGQC